MGQYRGWDKYELEQIKCLYELGVLTLQEIGDIYNVSESTIGRLLKKLKVPRNRAVIK